MGAADTGLCDDEYLLIVDDDDEMRDSLSELFRDEGFTVHESVHGLDALEHLRVAPKARLILLDYMMPTMNGAEFRAAQLADPALAVIPVVMFSAAAHVPNECRGVAAFLAKPIAFPRLLETVRRVMSSPVGAG